MLFCLSMLVLETIVPIGRHWQSMYLTAEMLEYAMEGKKEHYSKLNVL